MSFEFGDVVLVAFPFTDQSTSKKRPAVIVSSSSYERNRPDLILIAVTSQLRPSSSYGEIVIHRVGESRASEAFRHQARDRNHPQETSLAKRGKLDGPDRDALRSLIREILT